jgi:hypothetical protein
MSRDEFFADPAGCWFSPSRGEIEPGWFAAVWRADAALRDELTYDTKRYLGKVGILADPDLVAMLARALTRDEVLAVAEEFRRHAPGRVLEWGAAFERAAAPLDVRLSVPAGELAGVGRCLLLAVQERNLDAVRFMARCLREAGLPPEWAAVKEFDLPAAEVAMMPRDQLDRAPFRWVPVVEIAERLGLREFAQVIRSGGQAEAEPPATPYPAGR